MSVSACETAQAGPGSIYLEIAGSDLLMASIWLVCEGVIFVGRPARYSR